MTEILITGGSDGIGLATAKLLAREGARLTLVARSESRLETAVRSLSGSGHTGIAADLSHAGGVERMTQHLMTTHYQVLINNAGFGLYGRFAELPLAEQERMMDLNMASVVTLSHAFLRHAVPGDALVNTASFLGYAPLPGAAVYSATKAFVAAFSESLWWEYRKRGVFVLGFSPGVITTQFHESAGGSAERFPKFLMQSAEETARSLVRALGARRGPEVISGTPTRLFIWLHRMLGRRIGINVMGTSSPIADG